MHLSLMPAKKVSSYSTEYKIEATKFAEESKSIPCAAKKFNVDRKIMNSWMAKRKAKLQAADTLEDGVYGVGTWTQDRLINKLIGYILQVRWQRKRHSYIPYNHSDITAMDGQKHTEQN